MCKYIRAGQKTNSINIIVITAVEQTYLRMKINHLSIKKMKAFS